MSDVADEKLQCLILDENKVVTYKFLSKYLKVHAQQAKEILSSFYETNKQEYSLDAFYYVFGSQNVNGSKGFKACLVSSAELDDVKSSFSSSPSIHIYCVYKGKDLDKNTLYTVDYEGGEEKLDLNSLSCISSPHVEVRSRKLSKPVVANNVQTKSDSAKSQNQTSNKTQPKAPPAKRNSGDVKSLFQKKSNENSKPGGKSESQDSKDSSPKPKASENEVKTSNNKKPEKKSNVKNLISSRGGAGMNFVFTKSTKPLGASPMASNTTRSDSENVQKPSSENIQGKPSSEDLQKKHNSENVQKRLNSDSTKKKPQIKRAKSNQNSYNEDSDNEDLKPKKKHKRIVEMEDSDSESENEEAKDMAQRNILSDKMEVENTVDEDDEELIPPTPPAPKFKTLIQSVTTTATDGEFLVTKIEKQCVTVPDEEAKPSKPKAFKAPVSKKGPVNKKQSSLTGFFKQR